MVCRDMTIDMATLSINLEWRGTDPSNTHRRGWGALLGDMSDVMPATVEVKSTGGTKICVFEHRYYFHLKNSNAV